MKPKNVTIFVSPFIKEVSEKNLKNKCMGTLVPSQNVEGKYVSNCQKCWEKFFFMDNYSIFYSKVGAGGDGWLRLRNTAGCSWATSSVHEHWAFHRVGLKLFLKIKYYIF